jgi:protein-tyrosine phosphatase
MPVLYPVNTPELKGRVVITRRPRGFEFIDIDVASWAARGIDVVVSMLEAEEAKTIGLDQQGAACARHGITFVHVPVADFAIPPSVQDAHAVVKDLGRELDAGKTIAFHCFASRGRSPTLAAAVLIHQGLSAATAIARLSEARGHDIPETSQQLKWIKDYADFLRL